VSSYPSPSTRQRSSSRSSAMRARFFIIGRDAVQRIPSPPIGHRSSQRAGLLRAGAPVGSIVHAAGHCAAYSLHRHCRERSVPASPGPGLCIRRQGPDRCNRARCDSALPRPSHRRGRPDPPGSGTGLSDWVAATICRRQAGARGGSRTSHSSHAAINPTKNPTGTCAQSAISS
jgi:hypothetical protein